MILYLVFIKGSGLEKSWGLMAPFYSWLIEILLLVLLFASIGSANAELRCPEPIKNNHSKEAWNAKDSDVLRSAYPGCVRYDPRTPCVIEFIKLDVQNYFVVCGAKRRINEN